MTTEEKLEKALRLLDQTKFTLNNLANYVAALHYNISPLPLGWWQVDIALSAATERATDIKEFFKEIDYKANW